MRKSFKYLALSIFVLLLFNRCAQIANLTGGPKDVSPPKLIEAQPALNSTLFSSDLIVLSFDEFVQLKDLSNQLIVSPRIKSNVEISAEGKKIEIKLKKEELKPNTTYRIFIGKAIADMTESNSIENFEYVFSTGEKLDTLELSGTISDAFNNMPLGGMIIGLYSAEQTNDSVAYKEKADYFARSADNGQFLIKNLPAKNFKVFGISDINKNGKYDGESEKLAFLSNTVRLKSDTGIQLKLFQEEASKVFVKKIIVPANGLFQIILNKPSLASLETLYPLEKQMVSVASEGKKTDTLWVYYKNNPDTLKMILSVKSSNLIDTLDLVASKKKVNRQKIKNYHLNTSNDKLPLDGKLKLIFPGWMDTTRFDSSRLRLTIKSDSSMANQALRGRWTSITTFELDNKLKEGQEYSLKIDTAAFTDINQLFNDSMIFHFAVHSKSDFGKVRIKLKANKKQAYLIQLLNEQNVVAKEQFIEFSLSSSNAADIDFTDVLPGSYQVKIIFDTNANHKWDSGDMILKKLPEEVIINSKQLKVLADWEIEEEISIR